MLVTTTYTTTHTTSSTLMIKLIISKSLCPIFDFSNGQWLEHEHPNNIYCMNVQSFKNFKGLENLTCNGLFEVTTTHTSHWGFKLQTIPPTTTTSHKN
jgi:hypothetical protein